MVQFSSFAASLVSKHWQTTLRSAENLLFPPVCMHCDFTVHKSGLLCPECWSQIDHIEKPLCAVLGIPFSYDLGEGALSAEAIANPPSYDSVRSVVHYNNVAKSLVHALKFSDRIDLAPWLAKWMVNWCRRTEPGLLDSELLVIPVPLHRRRLLSRRFNQSAELARHFCRLADLRFRPDILQRTKSTRQQAGLPAKQRKRNVSSAFQVSKSAKPTLHGAHILLVDDVFTTGATLEACAKALKRAGASDVRCITFARVARDPV